MEAGEEGDRNYREKPVILRGEAETADLNKVFISFHFSFQNDLKKTFSPSRHLKDHWESKPQEK